MKNIVFASNYFSHHQVYLAEAFHRKTNHQFFFLTSEKMERERVELGWEDQQMKTYVHPINYAESVMLVDCADVVIAGSVSEKWIKNRIWQGKLTFRYSERPLKAGNAWMKYPIRFLRWHFRNPPGKPIYMLCASAFTALDYHKFGLFRNKSYQWGYFPELRRYPDVCTFLQCKDSKRILWAGRFLDWKHPDDAIQTASQLKKEGIPFQMDFIGTGPMEETMRRMISDLGLRDQVRILGPMPPAKVREEMERSGIYLFTSDRQEGWGAVLNESMNSGCAVVASHLIGSVPYLLKNNQNGLVYASGNQEMLFRKAKYLLEHPEEQQRLGKAAYETIAGQWNAEVAAQRFLNLAEHILAGEKSPDLYESGPCSRAKVIQESWFRE